MMKRLFAAACACALVGSAMVMAADTASAAGGAKPAALDFTMKDIDGKEVDLSSYAGKVVLVVNVASKCGNTPQYKGLEETYEKYKDKGFVILGFPANDFKSQEPGSNEQIKEFCTATYGVKFPMFSKITVLGPDKHPLYKYLTAVDTKPQPKGEITWNFEKFLIGKDGEVIARYAPKTKVDDPKVVEAIEAALAK